MKFLVEAPTNSNEYEVDDDTLELDEGFDNLLDDVRFDIGWLREGESITITRLYDGVPKLRLIRGGK